MNCKTNDDRTVKQNLVYDTSQKWVDIPSQGAHSSELCIHFATNLSLVEFVDHDRDETTASASQQARPWSSRATKESATTEDTQAETDYMPEPDQDPDQQEQILDFLSPIDIHTGQELSTNHPDVTHSSPGQSSARIGQRSLSQVSKRSRNDFFQSPSLVNTVSPSLAFKASWPCESQHEARLFHHYINVMAPWVSREFR